MKTSSAGAWLSLLRINQYTKNFFVLAPLFFSFKFRNIHLLSISLGGFAIFSAVASCVYILNDITDIKEDAQHPVKCLRPLPSKKISLHAAITAALVLLAVSFIIAFLFNIRFAVLLSSYFVINIFYSIHLKKIAILDIIIIAVGFVLRVYAGGALINVTPTMWLTLMTFLLSLILALGKRRDDVMLKEDGVKTRSSIHGYNIELLNYSIVTMAAVTLVCYIQYTISPEIILHFHNPYLYCNIIFVIAGFLRYFQVIFVLGGTANPSKIVLKDIFLQVDLVLWLASFILFIK
ncbi:MAG TPA: UbiA prenyltransferase family protein [Chitinophagaceae bacterium]|nr:UbiA prenyltransferase family protein [Chitinophagaceae bacterium]